MEPNKCRNWTSHNTRDGCRSAARRWHRESAGRQLPWIFRCRLCDKWHFDAKNVALEFAYGAVYTTFAGRRRA